MLTISALRWQSAPRNIGFRSFLELCFHPQRDHPSEDLHCLKIIEIPEKIIVSDFLHARWMILIVLHVAFHQYHPKTVLELDYFIIYIKKTLHCPKNPSICHMNRSVSVKRAHFPRLLLLNKASPHAMDSLGRNAFRHAKMAGYDLPQLEKCSVLWRIRWSFSNLVLFQPCKSYKPPQNLRQSETCFWAGHWFSKNVQIQGKRWDLPK